LKLSTRARYGTRALIELALHKEDSPLTLREIADKQKISLSYLEHLISPLIARGFIRSVTGHRGGIYLNQAPDKIKLSDVVQALEGGVAAVDCVNDPGVCDQSKLCATRDVWSELTNVMIEFLDSITLQNLVERYLEKRWSGLETYNI